MKNPDTKARDKLIEEDLKDMGITDKGLSIGKELYLAILPIVERLEEDEKSVDEVRHFLIMISRAVALRKVSSGDLKG